MTVFRVLPFCFLLFLAACGSEGTFDDVTFNPEGLPVPPIDDTPDPAETLDRTSILGPWIQQPVVGFSTGGGESCILDFSTELEVQILPLDSDAEITTASYQILDPQEGVNFSMLTFTDVNDVLSFPCASAISLTDGPFFVEFSGDTMSWFPDPENDQADFSFDYIPFPEDVETLGSTASLVSLEPGSAMAGASTMFSVTLDYSVDVDSTLTVGLNDVFRDSFEPQVTLPLNAGDAAQETFNDIAGTVFDWGNDADFAVLVQITNTEGVVLSSYSFPISLTP